MLNQVYRLVSPHQFETVIVDEEIDKTDCIIVRPTYLSICHADQRYFTEINSIKEANSDSILSGKKTARSRLK